MNLWGRFLLVFSLAFGQAGFALIFPLEPGEKGAYDVNFNVVDPHRAFAEGHAVINVLGANGVAIAPRWFLTAAHLVRGADKNTWVSDGVRRYEIEEVVELNTSLSPDTALVRVNQPFPFYSELAKRPLLMGDVLTVYGRSGAAQEPILDTEFRGKGWKLAPPEYFAALRRGLARKATSDPRRIVWRFTDQDPDLGFNCAATATNDSGGGIFLNGALAGISYSGGWTSYRTNRAEPSNCRSSTNSGARGHIFDGSSLYRCSSDSRPLTESAGSAIYPQLANIFARISPPTYLNAGGPDVIANGKKWQGLQSCSNCFFYTDTVDLPVDTASVRDAAPDSVYRSVAYLESEREKTMTFTIDDLIVYERYRVRLHFAGVYPLIAPGRCVQRVIVNGQGKVIDPFNGLYKASDLTFYNVAPNRQGQITITINPENDYGNATLSGIEVAMVPVWPSPVEGLQWETVSLVSPGSARPIVSMASKHRTLVGIELSEAERYSLIISTNGGEVFDRVELSRSIELSSIETAGDHFVAVGLGGVILTSTNGVDWLEVTGNSAHLYSVTHRDGVTVIVGDGGAILYSDNLANVSAIPSPTSLPLYTVTRGAGLFVAAGASGTLIRSTNGKDWNVQAHDSDSDLFGVAYGNGRFVAVGSDGIILSSTDGQNWETMRTSAGSMLTSVEFGNGYFFALEHGSNRALVSPDGLNWNVTILPRNGPRLNSSEGVLWLTSSDSYVARASLFLKLHGGLDANGTFALTFHVPVPGDYVLLAAKSLPAPSWETVAVFTNLTSKGTWTETNRLPHTRFYGVRPFSTAH